MTNLEQQLGELLENHEQLCMNQKEPCGDCRRLMSDLSALIEQRELAARIDEHKRVASFYASTANNDDFEERLFVRIAALQADQQRSGGKA